MIWIIEKLTGRDVREYRRLFGIIYYIEFHK